MLWNQCKLIKKEKECVLSLLRMASSRCAPALMGLDTEAVFI